MKNVADLNKIAVIGTGAVGMAAGYSLFQQKLANDIVLVDMNAERARGEALDLMHGQPLVGRCRVTSGSYENIVGCGIVVICAGVGQSSPDEDRLALLGRNIAVFKSIASELDKYVPDALILIASNPVDILTYAMQDLSSRPNHLIIGTGTLLDTSRFQTLLADHYRVSPQSVLAYILGEHGDSEVPIWSSATVAGLSIVSHTINGQPYDKNALETIVSKVKNAAYEIIANKGYTNWAIGLVIANIVRSIRSDQRNVMPVSVRLEGYYGLNDVCLSLPAIIGSQGLDTVLCPDLTVYELEGLTYSANTLKKLISQLT